MNNIKKKTVLIYLVTIILIFLSILSYADTPPMPGLPHAFYGTVKYDDGTPLPDGSVVKAVVDNENYTTTVINGTYGVNTPFYVEDPDNDNIGKTIVFYIDDKNTGQTTIFDPGTTNLNLTLEKDSNGGNGGGSPGGGGLPTEEDNLLYPVARINAPSYGFVNQSISINASGSYDPDGEILFYIWSFGDGSNGSGFETTHIYESAGEYQINLVVTDDDNLTDTDEINISILDSNDKDDYLPDADENNTDAGDNDIALPSDNNGEQTDDFEDADNGIYLLVIIMVVVVASLLLWKLKYRKK